MDEEERTKKNGEPLDYYRGIDRQAGQRVEGSFRFRSFSKQNNYGNNIRSCLQYTKTEEMAYPSHSQYINNQSTYCTSTYRTCAKYQFYICIFVVTLVIVFPFTQFNVKTVSETGGFIPLLFNLLFPVLIVNRYAEACAREPVT